MTFTNTSFTKNVSDSSIAVLTYSANIVGFVRVALLGVMMVTCYKAPIVTVVLYITSLILDGVDGFLARTFKQTSHFGAVLDMVTDRASVALLLLVLSHIYHHVWWLFALLLLLDLTSHMAVIYSSAILGSQSHKQTLLKAHKILRLYYGNRWVLSLTCLTHDICLCAIYLYASHGDAWLFKSIMVLSLGLAFKTYIHIMQLLYASKLTLSK